MKKPITKPKQRSSAKMIKKKGKDVVTISGKKGATAEKSGTASARTHKTFAADRNRKDSAALKKIETKNWQLTRELEQKNRELKIEAALEKVRAASSAMVKTEELSRVVSVMYKQFELLKDNQVVGFELALCDEAKGELQFWSSSLSQKNLPECYTIQKASHPFFKKQWNAWKAKKDRLVITLDELKYKEFCKFIFSQTDFKKFPNHVKKFIRSRKKDVFTHAWLKYGLLEAVADEALADEGFSLLQRFAKVFEQTYTRFLDLQKAEAQAREAQIEAALERVRSRSMSMHRSNELAEVSGVLYEELIKLGIKGFVNCGFVEVDEKKKAQHGWTTMPDGSQAEGYYLPLCGDEVLNERYKAWQGQVPAFHQSVNGKRLRKHLAFATPTLGSRQIEEMARRNFPDPTIFYCFNFRQGYLHIITGNTFSELHEAILVRFGKAFEQTYTRFLDLQKAEAQARDAQIEAALERVRARALAMHTSEELKEVALVLREQIDLLGQTELNGMVVELYETHPKHIESWFAFLHPAGDPNAKMVTGVILFEKKSCAVIREMIKKYQGPLKQYTIEASGDKIKEFYKVLQPLVPEAQNVPKQEFYHCADFSGGTLLLASVQEPSSEAKDLLMRSASVFDLAYRRLLDLKKAEAQAREAQIEAALERVRSRSMAMHRSDELSDVVLVLYQQMETLGFAKGGCELILCNEKSGLLEYWHTNPIQSSVPGCYCVSPEVHDFFKKVWKAWKQQAPRLVIEMKDQEKRELDIALLEKTDFKRIDKKTKNWILKEKVAVFSHVTMKFGLLEAIDSIPISVEQLSILQRFAKVFEQTYTRFLDLQKAEAQAKEAEIQLGLERVRAASMAMHESKELTKIVALVYEQLSSLGFDSWSYLIRTREDTREGFTTWLSLKEMSVLPEGYHMPKLNHPIHKKVMKAWDDQLEYHVIGFGGKEKTQYDDLLFTKTEWKKFPKKVKDAFRFMKRAVVCSSNYKHIGLQVVGTESLPEEQSKILIRFAKAFEQTYTRFLDLQKAEAQAKEAEIELALERVRAKTMAMQKSEELRELVFEYYKQIHPFGFAKWGFEIKIAKEDKSGFYCWISPPGARVQPEGFNIPTLDHWVLKKYWSVYEQQIPITSIVNSGADKRKLAVLLLEKSDMKNLPEDVKANIMETEYVHFSVAAMRFGLLKAVDMEPVPEKDASILQRFAKVFEQTYTRFLDLQKAEAQAREAEIQLALERIRARTMAMHKSEELGEVSETLYAQLQNLGITQFINCGYLRVDEENKIQSGWASMPGDKPMPFSLPLCGDPVLAERIKAWKEGVPVITQKVSGKILAIHLKNVMPFLGSREVEEMVSTQFTDPTFFYIGSLRSGYLFLVSNTSLNNQQLSLFDRFTRAFELAFQRFLDLQKAEAQAREAKIEVALERIRSRMMAMHKTDELHEVLGTVFTQLQSLGFDAPGSALIIYNKDLAAEHWMTGFSGGQFPESYKIPYNDILI